MHFDTQRSTRNGRAAGSWLAAGVAVLLAAAGFAGAATPVFVPVGDAGNAKDATGFGAVSYAYRIGAFEVTRTEYAAFLNAVAATDTHTLYNPSMNITRAGASGSYTYSAVAGTCSVAYVSWYDALRFANWLHNGQPTGAQTAATTEDGAYAFTSDTNAGPRKAGAKAYLPNEDEWYKAAYYQGGTDAWYWAFPTRSDTAPLATPPPGDDNSANYDRIVGGVTAAGAYGLSQGFYGTHDQAGNLWEWIETAMDTDRGIRGGSYVDYPLLLNSWYRDSQDPAQVNEFVGFRIAAAAAVVPPVNHPPVAASESYPVNEDTTLTVAAPGVLLNDTDADRDPLTAVLVTGPTHGFLTLSANGSFVYVPAANYNGPDNFTYKPNDGKVDGNTVTVSITVIPVNDAPVAVGESYTVNQGATLTVTAPGVLSNDTDVDGDVLTAILVGSPAHGALTLSANGSFTYVPTASYSGADSFTYKPNDGKVDGNTVTVSITVKPVIVLYALVVGNGSGAGSYAAGTVVTIVANPAPAGQVFDRWTGSTASVANVTAASTTLTMPAGAATVTATYKPAPGPAFTMTSAEWRSATQELRMSGTGRARQTVVITDTARHTLGSCVIQSDGTWTFSVRLSSRNVPTQVRATCNGVTVQMTVRISGGGGD